MSSDPSTVADDERLIDEAQDAPDKERLAEQIRADTIPLRGRGGKETLRGGAAPLDHRRQPALVLSRCRRALHLLADERPQLPRAGIQVVEAHAVEPARAVAP